MTVKDLAPFGDELLLVVMGPGLGECVLLRWPPDRWLVIDSFRRSRGDAEWHPAAELLDHFGERADAVALTHPHDDHTNGLASLIDRRKPGGSVGWWPEAAAAPRWTTPNGAQAARLGTNEQAIAAIERVWREEPATRWELHGGADPLVLGDATVRVLAPLPDAIAHSKTVADPDPNEMSSAMVLDWHSCRLVLGADLVNQRGWDAVVALHGHLAFATSVGVKIAHHGSKEAQHTVALGSPPPTARTFLGAPYNRGRKVPDFRDGEDVALLLGLVHRLLMSTHHSPVPVGAGHAETPRSHLQPNALSAGPLTIELDAGRPDLYDCWVAARWAPDGTLLSTHRGAASLSIVA